MADIASLLQISDLHFFEKVTFRGGRHWGFRAFGVKGHSHSKLYTFTRTLLTQRLTNGLEDVIVATGDISTDGTEKSLRIAKEFFDSPRVYEDGRHVAWGLAAPKHSVILPGNHDRYGDTFLAYESAQNRELEKVFEIEDKYPYVVGYRRPEENENPADPTLLFYVFDSTLTGEPAESKSPWRRISRGIIRTEECDWLEKTTQTLRSEGEVPNLNGEPLRFDFNNSIRIALLHHHPVLKQGQGLFQLLDQRSWSVMEQADSFINACFNAEIDLVLFGHEHENYNEKEQREIGTVGNKRVHTIRFVCCPSTMEYSCDQNGFYTIDFNADEYVMTLYQWNSTAYIKSRVYNQSYNRPLILQTQSSSKTSGFSA